MTLSDSTTVDIQVWALIMVKNEEKTIRRTLNSIYRYIDGVFILDTGSTDSTLVEIYQCKKDMKLDYPQKEVTIIIAETEFIDFSTTRNYMLDKARDTIPRVHKHPHLYFLLMDANDELQLEGTNASLVDIITQRVQKTNSPPLGFLIKQKLSSNSTIGMTYYNIRLVNSLYNWKYAGLVHEFISYNDDVDDTSTRPADLSIHKLDTITLFQNRDFDYAKTELRFARDVELLGAELERQRQEGGEEKIDPRTCFYLAQSLQCIGDIQGAINTYKLRASITNRGFWEERFVSLLRMGELLQRYKQQPEEAMVQYMAAYNIDARAEPLLCIADMYLSKQQYSTAYMYILTACELDYPHDRIMFVNVNDYTYRRWHLMGICAYYVRKSFPKALMTGRMACQNANADIDKSNLKFYNTC